YLNVQDNLVNTRLFSVFHVKNTPADRFRIRAPISLKDSIKIHGEGIRTVLTQPDADGKWADIDVHTLSPVEADHTYMLEIAFKRFIGDDKLFDLPHIVFPEASNITEYIAVETNTAYQIESEPTGKLLEIEKDRIPAYPDGADLNRVLWTFRCAPGDDWGYRLRLKRLAREKLAAAGIARMDIRTVLLSQGIAMHEALLKVRNRTLQFLPVDFPQDAEIWSVRAAGDPVRPALPGINSGVKAGAQSDKNWKRLLIPLIKSETGDRNFDVKIVFRTDTPAFSF
ncbi:MAG: hypothetical protein GY850_03265, partial [bacterium]|nr:hypothetical protein [bacterium]